MSFLASFLTSGQAVMVALIAAIATLGAQWMARKPPRMMSAEVKKAEADAAAMIVASFEKLVADLQEERRAYKDEITNLRRFVKALQHYTRRIVIHDEALERLLRENGISIPMPCPHIPAEVHQMAASIHD